MVATESVLVSAQEVMVEGANHAFYLCGVKDETEPELMFVKLATGNNSQWTLKERVSRIQNFQMTGRLNMKNGIMNIILHSITLPTDNKNVVKKALIPTEVKQILVPSMQRAGLYGSAILTMTSDLLPKARQRAMVKAEESLEFKV